MAAFHAEAARKKCVVCPARASRWAHHVIPKSLLRHALGHVDKLRVVAIVWDCRNALPLCDECHERHHSRSRPLPARVVGDAAREFAREIDGLVPGDPFTLYLEQTYGVVLGGERAA